MLKPNLPGDGIRGGACGRGLGHEAGALLNGISATVKLRELSYSLPLGEDTAERWAMNQELMPHRTLNLVEPRSWTSQPQKPRNECLSFKPASVW